jgi:3',5'-cyclic AMP phosphodiesterase CpdA
VAVSEPFLLVQLSDPHIGAEWGGGDSVARLDAVVEAVKVLQPRPRAILLSGDLADHAADSEYRLVRERLALLDAPLHVLPGNHDRRDALRRHFDLPGEGGAPVQYAVDLGLLRLVVVDSTHPGEDWGAVDEERLTWLDHELAANPDRPTLIAIHHPPLVTGVPAMDEVGLRAADRDALGRVIERHLQVKRVIAGHVHRGLAGDVAGRPVFVAPSIYVAARLDFRSGEVELTDEPPGFAVHALLDGKLVSHLVRVL